MLFHLKSLDMARVTENVDVPAGEQDPKAEE